MRNRIKKIIDEIIPVCNSWIIKNGDGMVRLVDPNDRVEISAHYGATHVAAAFIIWGNFINDELLYNRGITLLRSILTRWDYNKSLPEFHFDFNNFALTILEPFIDEQTATLVRDIICTTRDSNHNTINWLPMRWAVNKKRKEWTNNKCYEEVIESCRKIIGLATNLDGGVEDRLPYGLSFNLQYDLATVAVLQYLRVSGERIDLSKELGFLLKAVAPDGDINYQGRGTNQVFAWGLWIYLLSSSGNLTELGLALDYFEPRYKSMLSHGNIMLNDWEGSEKYLWWDYHYASVYISHCLLWLVMSYVDIEKASIKPIYSDSTKTGLHIYNYRNFFVSTFDGRTEYLAEKGPVVAVVWSRHQGMICKGTFAPWKGHFGNKYIYEDIVIKNFCGLLELTTNKDWSRKRYVSKIVPNFKSKTKCTFSPAFCPIFVKEENDLLEITWEYIGKKDLIFNLPSQIKDLDFRLWVDGNEMSMMCNSVIRNQYGWNYLYQSRIFKAHHVRLVIR